MPNPNDTLPTQTTTRPDPLSLAYAPDVPAWRQNFSNRAMLGYASFWGWITQHWLLVLGIVNLGCVAVAVAAPLFALIGWTFAADFLYGAFQILCVQNPTHTFYIGGKPMCLCQRCIGIYGGLFLAGTLFMLVRGYAKPLKLWVFALVFCTPIALDSFTQMFGWRESIWELRLFSGAWFALGAVWVLYPLIESKMGKVRRWVAREKAELQVF